MILSILILGIFAQFGYSREITDRIEFVTLPNTESSTDTISSTEAPTLPKVPLKIVK